VGALAFVRVGQDGLGRFEIRVEVAENGDAHDNESGFRRLVGYPLIWRNVQLNFELLRLRSSVGSRSCSPRS